MARRLVHGWLVRSRTRADWDMLDENHDGYLSMEEFQQWPRAGRTKTPERGTVPGGTVPGGSSGAQHLPMH
jgi:hypothetical protein